MGDNPCQVYIWLQINIQITQRALSLPDSFLFIFILHCHILTTDSHQAWAHHVPVFIWHVPEDSEMQIFCRWCRCCRGEHGGKEPCLQRIADEAKNFSSFGCLCTPVRSKNFSSFGQLCSHEWFSVWFLQLGVFIERFHGKGSSSQQGPEFYLCAAQLWFVGTNQLAGDSWGRQQLLPSSLANVAVLAIQKQSVIFELCCFYLGINDLRHALESLHHVVYWSHGNSIPNTYFMKRKKKLLSQSSPSL